MSLFRRTIQSSAWTVSGMQVVAILGFASSVVAAHFLSPSDLGMYGLASAIASLVGSAAVLQAGGYYVVTHEPSERLLRTGLTLELLIGAGLFTLLSAGAIAYGSESGNYELPGLLIVSGLVLLTNPFGSLRCTFERDLSYGPQTVTLIMATGAGAATKIALVIAGAGPWGLVWGDVVISALYGTSMLILVPEGRGFAIDRALARKQLGFGIPSAISGVLQMATVRGPDLIIASVLGTAQLGYYFIASRIPMQIYTLGRSLSLALLPAFSRLGADRLEEGFALTTRFSGFLMALPTAVILGLSTLITVLLFGSEWRPSAEPLAILMVALAIRFIFWHFGNLLKSQLRVAEVARVNALQLVLTLILTPAGAMISGLTGAAVAILAVDVLLIPLKVHLVRRIIRFAPVEALIRPSIALVLALLGALASNWVLNGWSAVAVGTGAAALTWGWVMYVSDKAVLIRIISAFRRHPTSSGELAPDEAA